MALTERTEDDKLEVVGPYKNVSVRTATIIERDGVEISRTFSRRVIAPDADISNESSEIQGICNVVHTQSVKDAWAAHLAAQVETT